MKEFDINIEETRFVCKQLEEGFVEITGFRGSVAKIAVPEAVTYNECVYVVKGIGKKAFLGNRVARSVILPKSIEWIGDWAFAQCEQLERVAILARTFEMGNGVFLDCKKIESVIVGGEEEDAMSKLLAATIDRMPSEDLIRDRELGSKHWYQKWDQRLLAFLGEADDDGYTNLVLCGEEDITRSETEFAGDKRRRKAGLCLCRLMNDEQLETEARQVYLEYLQSHTKGCESEEAWEYVVMEHGNELSFYRVFGELGCISSDNIDAMIQDFGTEYAEAKAYMLQYKQEHFAVENVFDMFTL